MQNTAKLNNYATITDYNQSVNRYIHIMLLYSKANVRYKYYYYYPDHHCLNNLLVHLYIQNVISPTSAYMNDYL